jgi:hypothetical protein
MNGKVKSKIVEIVENQLTLNEPKCTKETFDRLMELGITREKAIEMIGVVFVKEMADMMKKQAPFDEERYANKLLALPQD